MSSTIEQIEQQIAELQKTLNELKNPKLEIVRNFTGQYFAPYQGMQYRRMESEGVPIWEYFLDTRKEWVILSKIESTNLEMIYLKDCISNSEINEEPVSITPEIVSSGTSKPTQKSFKETITRGTSSAKRIISRKS